MGRSLAQPRAFVVLAFTVLLSACGTVEEIKNQLVGGPQGPQIGQAGFVSGFLGGIAADDPQAALVGRDVLSAGGNAADAAVAVGLTMAVTQPSRAGLGGGGACLAYAASPKSINKGVPEAILFTPIAPTTTAAPADRPAAVPMMARGLYLLHVRYGRLPFESLVVRAEQLARFGTTASRALARDLGLVATPLFADPGARAVFSRDGVPLREGQNFAQPDLAATLTQIRVAGVGDMYQGALARRIEQGSLVTGGPLTVGDLRAALPTAVTPVVLREGNDQIAFLPPPADGGLAAAAAFQTLGQNPADLQGAAARSLAVAARWRAGGVTPEAALAAGDAAGGLPSLPASTSFVTMDHDGNAVACALTMDNLFGTGRMLPGLGFVAAASPASVPLPLLSAGLAWNPNLNALRAVVAGSGQAGAPMAVAVGMMNALRTRQPMAATVPDPGRANVAACSRYLPGEAGTCGVATDPREPGLAVGGN